MAFLVFVTSQTHSITAINTTKVRELEISRLELLAFVAGKTTLLKFLD